MQIPRAASSEESLRYEGWRVAAASGGSLFLASAIIYTFGVFFKPLASEFGWSRETVSTAYGAMAFSSALSAPVFGVLLDRIHVRRVIVPCMVILAGTFASLSLLAGRQSQFFVTFAVLGVVGTGLSPVGYSRAVSTWFQRRRGLALGLVIAGGALATVVQPPITQSLIDAAGWRTTYIVIGAIMLVLGVPLVLAFVRPRPIEVAVAARPITGATLRDGLRSRMFWTIALVLFASSIALNGAIVHLSALLTDRGVSAASAALAISIMGAASL